MQNCPSPVHISVSCKRRGTIVINFDTLNPLILLSANLAANWSSEYPLAPVTLDSFLIKITFPNYFFSTTRKLPTPSPIQSAGQLASKFAAAIRRWYTLSCPSISLNLIRIALNRTHRKRLLHQPSVVGLQCRLVGIGQRLLQIIGARTAIIRKYVREEGLDHFQSPTDVQI